MRSEISSTPATANAPQQRTHEDPGAQTHARDTDRNAQPQRRRQISDDENPNHFVFGRGWLPKAGCKICIECRLRNDPVGFALTLAYNRATHYSDEVLRAAGAPTSPGGRYLLPAGFPSPTPS